MSDDALQNTPPPRPAQQPLNQRPHTSGARSQVERTPTIEELRRRAPATIANSLTSAFRAARSPHERFDSLTELTERLALRACELLNSAYLHSARLSKSVQEVEHRLAELGRKNLSFGDYVGALDMFLRRLDPRLLDGRVTPFWTDIAVPLRLPLPTVVSEDVAALHLIKRAREKYEVPVHLLERFVEDQTSGGPKKQTLGDVLSLAATYRNAKAHHHAWFAENARWYALITERWRRILEKTLLHPPVYALLDTVEVVSTAAEPHRAEPGRILYDATRDELHELLRPLPASRMASAEPLIAGRYWVRRSDDAVAPLETLFPWRSFPENVEPPRLRERRYRSRTVELFLSAGALRAVDIDETLRPLQSELGIEESRAHVLREETIAALRAAEAESRRGADGGELKRLIALVHDIDEERLGDLAQKLATLDELRADRLYRLVEDQFPIRHRALIQESEMAAEDVARALDRLLAGTEPARAVRKVVRAPGRIQYRIPSVREAEDLRASLEELRAQPSLLEQVRPLLVVCREFFQEEGHPELPGAIEALLRDGASEDDAPTEAPRLLFAARGAVVEESSVPDLFRAIAERFGADQALQSNVPFATGRKRHLVAREARHVAGHDFVAPLEVPEHGIVFEANQSRESALKNLRHWFRAASIRVDRAEIDGCSVDELNGRDATADDLVASGGANDELVLEVDFGDRVETVTGRTVGAFLSKLVEVLVDEGRLEVERLPISTGRVRYLIAQDPHHANGRRFDSPVEVDGMYIETAHPRSVARSHAEALCHELNVGVTVADPDSVLP